MAITGSLYQLSTATQAYEAVACRYAVTGQLTAQTNYIAELEPIYSSCCIGGIPSSDFYAKLVECIFTLADSGWFYYQKEKKEYEKQQEKQQDKEQDEEQKLLPIQELTSQILCEQIEITDLQIPVVGQPLSDDTSLLSFINASLEKLNMVRVHQPYYSSVGYIYPWTYFRGKCASLSVEYSHKGFSMHEFPDRVWQPLYFRSTYGSNCDWYGEKFTDNKPSENRYIIGNFPKGYYDPHPEKFRDMAGGAVPTIFYDKSQEIFCDTWGMFYNAIVKQFENFQWKDSEQKQVKYNEYLSKLLFEAYPGSFKYYDYYFDREQDPPLNVISCDMRVSYGNNRKGFFGEWSGDEYDPSVQRAMMQQYVVMFEAHASIVVPEKSEFIMFNALPFNFILYGTKETEEQTAPREDVVKEDQKQISPAQYSSLAHSERYSPAGVDVFKRLHPKSKLCFVLKAGDKSVDPTVEDSSLYEVTITDRILPYQNYVKVLQAGAPIKQLYKKFPESIQPDYQNDNGGDFEQNPIVTAVDSYTASSRYQIFITDFSFNPCSYIKYQFPI